MSNTKSLKRALISSILVLALCFTMLLGTTFAWFTDSAASSGNVIQSGTLNIDLLVKGGNTGYTDYTSVKNSSAPVFNYDKWEPGYTVWANAKVTTTGNLAVKYTMKITADETPSILADVIDVYYAPSEVAQPATRDLSGLTRIGTLSEVLAGTVVINDYLIPGTNEADFATLALHMQETAGNEYQDKAIGSTFSIMILATQYTYEEDSFDNQYDASANLNFMPVLSAAGFTDALSAGVSANLSNDVQLGETYQVTSNQDVVIDGNGNTLSSATGTRVINLDTAPDASVTINGVNIDAAGKERAVSVYGSENANITVNNSEATAEYYTFNIASNAPGTTLDINNTTVTGWCAFQTWSSNVTINVNDSTLIGLNNKPYNADGWNNFSTIVINEPAQGSVITIRNTRIEANSTTGNKQTFLSMRAASGATVVFENCTFFKDGVQITDMQEIVNNITFTSQAAIDNSHLTINGVVILP